MTIDQTALPHGVEIRASLRAGYERILTTEALSFIAGLERKFGAERRRLLALRA
jgi:malate synthase